MSRLLLLTTSPQPDCARAARHRLRKTVEAAVSLGFEPDILGASPAPAVPGSRALAAPQLPLCQNLPERPSLRRLCLKALLLLKAAALASRTSYDLIHGEGGAATVAWLVARLTRTPLVIERCPATGRTPARLAPPHRLAARVSLSLERRALCAAAAVIGPDPSVVALLQSLGRRSRACMIPDLPPLLQPVPEPARNLARARFRSGGCRLLVTCLAPSEEAAADPLPKTLRLILDAAPDTRFAFAGATAGFLHRFATRLDPSTAAATTLPSGLTEGEYAALLGVSDILVSTETRPLPLPALLLDGLAAGVPLVATDTPANRSLLTPRNAILAAPTPSALAAAVLALSAQPDRRTALAARGFDTLRNESRTVEDYRQALRRCYGYALSTPPNRADT